MLLPLLGDRAGRRRVPGVEDGQGLWRCARLGVCVALEGRGGEVREGRGFVGVRGVRTEELVDLVAVCFDLLLR